MNANNNLLCCRYDSYLTQDKTLEKAVEFREEYKDSVCVFFFFLISYATLSKLSNLSKLVCSSGNMEKK